MTEDFARRARVETRLETPEAPPALPPEVEVAIYRVVQEALTNVARHAGARHVHVSFAVDPAWVRLHIEDDGRGVRGEPVPHLGLLGMRERVTALGGTLSLAGREGTGLRIDAAIPRAAA